MLQNACRRAPPGGGVSILTRPEGRVLPLYCGPLPPFRKFQSSPDPKAGCYFKPWYRKIHIIVSILTRPEGRVLPLTTSQRDGSFRFQSSPDPKAGCYEPTVIEPLLEPRFNPHPTRRPGATEVPPDSMDMIMFQSSPDPKAGCYPVLSVYLGV